MDNKHKISLPIALMININIIIGAGVFLNVKPLTKIAGSLGFAGYITGALLLLPFVYTLAKLAQANPVAGGLYAYNKNYLNEFAGFISGWMYFIGKTVSAAFLSYAFTSFVQKQIPFLQPYPTILLTSIVIFFLIGINIAGARIGGKIQLLFFSAKATPLLFAIIFGLTATKKIGIGHFAGFKPLIATIPIALYSLMGFEITCAIGHMIKNPKENIHKVILGSFAIVTTIYLLFQKALFGALGNQLITSDKPLTLLAENVLAAPLIGNFVTALVFTSVISSAFGILTSNCWNLQVLAKDKHLPAHKTLSKTYRQVPWVSLVLEGIIACILLIISKNQIALQSMSVFGVVCSFLLCAVAAYQGSIKNKLTITKIIPILAIASCAYTLFLCFQKIAHAGVSVPYLAILIGGIIVAVARKYH